MRSSLPTPGGSSAASTFSAFFSRRQLALPSSCVTPLNTRPALRPRWCPAPSPITVSGLLPSARITASAFLPFLRKLSFRPQQYYFSGLNHMACILAPSCFAHPISEIARGLRYRPAGYALVGWDLSTSCSHPLANISTFHRTISYPTPSTSRLTWHEIRVIR